MVEVGLRVVRGKDWNWGDQDGGEGRVGTVIEVGGQGGSRNPDKTAVVLWDNGTKANYRMGYQCADDLRVLDSAPAGVRHTNITCDVCKANGLVGTRWKCNVCHDFDLCHDCYMSGKHDLQHPFARYDTCLSWSVNVPKRANSRQIQARGIYTGAKVAKGQSWSYGNQDGGGLGTVVSIGSSSDNASWRSWAKVKWAAGGTNDYRRAHLGFQDLKCSQEGVGEKYYVDHLSALSEYVSFIINNGERVKLLPDAMTDPHRQQLSQYLKKTGNIVILKDEKRMAVQFADNSFTLPMNYIVKTFTKGDTVEVSSDETLVRKLQQGHGGWTDGLKPILGKNGKISSVDDDGDVKVSVGDNKFILNPYCCRLVQASQNVEDSDEDEEGAEGNEEESDSDDDSASGLMNLFQMLLALQIQGSISPDSLVKDAAEGNVDSVKAILARYPNAVNNKVKDMTSLHVACHQGHLDVVVVLLKANAAINVVDSNGDNAFHFAVLGNQPRVLDLLIKVYPDLKDSVNSQNFSCLHLAVIKQHLECVKVLLNCKCNVNLQGKDRSTALHLALDRQSTAIIDVLMSTPNLDYKLKNDSGFNVLHLAALKNNNSALQKMVKNAPQLVNVAKEDGFTPLHIAAVNGHKAVADTLITLGKANMEMRNNSFHTPLLIAISKGRASMIEFLVQKGAQLDAVDKDGDSSLHLVVQHLKPVGQGGGLLGFMNILFKVEPKDIKDAPTINKIFSELPPNLNIRAWLAIACFLVQNGAPLDLQNNADTKPLDQAMDQAVRNKIKSYIKVERRASARTSAAPSYRPVSTMVNLCKKCQKVDCEMTFYPCGHKVTCSNCSKGMKACLVCQSVIQEKVHSQDQASNNVSVRAAPSRQESTNTVNCPICQSRVRNVVFLCGHSCCSECSNPMKDCHVCGVTIDKKITLM